MKAAMNLPRNDMNPVSSTNCFARLLFVMLMVSGMSVQQSGADDYKIAPGDNVSIQVYGEPDLSFPSIQITRTGSIIYPFLGEIQVAGKSEVELARYIAGRLRDGYLIEPQVTVAITNYRPIYIEGEIEVYKVA